MAMTPITYEMKTLPPDPKTLKRRTQTRITELHPSLQSGDSVSFRLEAVGWNVLGILSYDGDSKIPAHNRTSTVEDNRRMVRVHLSRVDLPALLETEDSDGETAVVRQLLRDFNHVYHPGQHPEERQLEDAWTAAWIAKNQPEPDASPDRAAGFSARLEAALPIHLRHFRTIARKGRIAAQHYSIVYHP